ncbi:hypothetical protein IFM89_019157 [Coptis chinensis]|uniref:Uncharacterized protein n=1 Tax=Coptis chinensis TaxID=261450 RepID=A0A835H040_9MAGN|nr:hypothetical protein IFM89_019157 [Coptis chinensis]
MTEKDNHIRDVDVPKRMQEIPTRLSSDIKEDIPRFLELMHVEKCDESCPTLLKDFSEEMTVTEDRDKDTRILKWHKKLFESIIESIKTAEIEREVDDVDSKFNLHFSPGEVGVDEGQFKRPKRKSHYSICSKAGLWEVSRKIGHSSEQLGLLINLETMNIVPLNNAEKKESPKDLAQNFTCAMFETPQAMLKGARHMAAVEISCEPHIRKHVRGAKIWNEQRNLILKDAFSNFLIPLMEKKVRYVLIARSKKILLMEYGKQLWSKVSVAPYKQKGTNDVTSMMKLHQESWLAVRDVETLQPLL